MALTEYEERVIAELEAQLPPDEMVRFECFEALESPAPRSTRGRVARALACLLGGVALLVAVRHAGLLVELSNVSGVSSASITRALGVVGCGLILASALMLRRVLRDRPRRG